MPIHARSSQDLFALVVLALLTEQPRHPYEMQRLIHERHKDFVDGKPRALYHAVDQLARGRAIEPVETSREGKRPERTVYQITDAGRDKFDGWLRDLLETPRSEHPTFTAAVSLFCYLPEQAVNESLEARVVALEASIAAIDTSLRVLQGRFGLPRAFIIDHEYTRALRQAELTWVQGVIADLKDGRLRWNDEPPRQAEDAK